MSRISIAVWFVAYGLAAPVLAADGNVVWLIQNSPLSGGNGNSITIDQSAATNSLVKGILPSALGHLAGHVVADLDFDPAFAVQRGEGNSADLTLNGNGGRVQLLQSSASLLPYFIGSNTGYNSATVTIGSDDIGTLVQVGSHNVANLLLEGGGATGLITQLGSNLHSSLQVGPGGFGLVTQIGNNSDAGHLVVHAGTAAAIVQIGDNLRPVSDQALEIMSTSPGTVSVTQTAW